MSPINSENDLKCGASLGGCSILLILVSLFLPFKFTLFFSGLPIFISFLAYGSNCGVAATSLASVILFLTASLEASCDIFLNFIAPAALFGGLSIKNIVKGQKTWWYPESFLLQNFVLLSFFSVVFLSLFFYSEDVLLKASQEAVKVIFKPNDPNALLARQYLASSIKYSLGISVLTKMFIGVLNFNLARLILTKMRKNIRPSFSFKDLRTHSFIAIFPLVSLTLANLFPPLSFLFSGLFIVGLFAPMCVGFQVIRRFSDGYSGNRVMIAFFIVLLMLALPTITLLIILGIVDSFYPLKRSGS
ncbi:MAG: hypothetical protein LBO02_02730 [Holosporaceae bacterium]|jgi:hypothetical protein|nr:hypothetical protein [Holosporaceae bacterium]